MKLLCGILFISLAISLPLSAQSDSSAQTVETIVCIRHGEKPDAGLGQLTCRGLNRALALPKVLLGKYGAPQFVFAPSPTQKADKGGTYNYVRPLMTIEPTAVRCGLPVNTQYSFKDISSLETELDKPAYEKATIFIAWEHDFLDKLVKDLVKAHGGDSSQVPSWSGKDYDSIFLVKITRSAGAQSVSFVIDHEGLNNLSDDCP